MEKESKSKSDKKVKDQREKSASKSKSAAKSQKPVSKSKEKKENKSVEKKSKKADKPAKKEEGKVNVPDWHPRPKRALSAYFFFKGDKIPELQKDGMSFPDAVIKAGEIWKTMTEAEKDPFVKMQKKDEERQKR